MEMIKNKKSETNSSVKVLIRVRPLIEIEETTKNVIQIRSDEQSVTVKVDEYNVIQSKFDRALSEEKSQLETFQNIKPYIKEVFSSYNLTIFAYGQTGSGKTFTMFGRDWQNNFELISSIKKSKNKQNTPLQEIYEDSGIIPRAVYEIFQSFEQFKYDYNVFCSFLQIYNEKIFDLLNDNPNPHPLNIHQSKFQGIFVEGLGEFQVLNYLDCLHLLKRGEKNRKVRQTSMNAKSSRSHTIFKLIFQSKRVNLDGNFSKVAVNLCDLAGSEKINKNDKMENEHMQELKNINLSLTTLGKVINSLSKGQSKNIAAFRESKLTRLLQESLTGNTNTFILCTLSPSSKNIDETLSTLKFAERARHIKLTFRPNFISSQNNEVIMKLQEEMDQLKRILKQREKDLLPENLDAKMKLLEQQNRKLRETTQKKQNEFMNLMVENRKMKNQLVYMEKLARHEMYGGGDRELSINSSEFSEQEAPDHMKKQNRNHHHRKITALPELIQESRRKILIAEDSKKDKRSPQQKIQQKKQIIDRYQKLQQRKSSLENSVLYDISSSRTRKKSLEPYKNSRTIELPLISQDTVTSKTRKTTSYRDKIRQLEQRLRK